MKPQERTLSFTLAMFLFYFLSTSFFNWFNGTAFKAIGFYLFILFFDVLALVWIIKIILSPHFVNNKSLIAPVILCVIALLAFILLFTGSNTATTFLDNLYLVIALFSMAGLITWYKKTGILKPKTPINNQIIIDETDNVVVNRPPIKPSMINELEDELGKAAAITAKETKEYSQLKEAKQLTSAIIDQKIKAPGEVISQINDIVKSYNYLMALHIKTDKTQETLDKVIKTFPDIIEGLTSIYDQGIDLNLEKIEIDTQTLKNLLDLSGLSKSDFHEN